MTEADVEALKKLETYEREFGRSVGQDEGLKLNQNPLCGPIAQCKMRLLLTLRARSSAVRAVDS